jgi:glycosyltransferase involved in cell wall biosynthesis
MRICFFNRSYWPDCAATGQLLTELAEGLVNDHGHEVSVVAAPVPSENQAPSRRAPLWTEEHAGVRIHRAAGTNFNRRRFAGRVSNYVSYFASACAAGLIAPRPDVVVALTDPPIIGLAALMAAKRSGARFVFLCQDLFPEVTTLLEDFHSPVVDNALERINRLLVAKADAIVALGETMSARLVQSKGADPRKITVIHNWADCSQIVPTPKDNAFARAHDLVDKFVVMHSGNVGLSQNIDTLVDAAVLLQDRQDIVFAIVGDGAKRASLEARVAAKGLSNVRLFPYQRKEKLSESFGTADAFVVSLKRGLAGSIVPSKLYGILAAGRPYVAAVEPECEVALITRRQGTGVFAEPGDAHSLADAVMHLYSHRDATRLMGENARRAAFDFDRSKQIGRYQQLFCDVAGVQSAVPSRVSLSERSL